MKQRLHQLSLAVLAPLFTLAIMAWFGNRAEEKAAWSDAREEAERLTRRAATAIKTKFTTSSVHLPLYPDPLVPGAPSELDSILDSNDIKDLLNLRNNPNAGLSPAGLPRRVLASLRLHHLQPEIQTTEELLSLLTKEEPSILTTRALQKLNLSTAVSEDWARAEEARRLLRTLPQLPNKGIKIQNDKQTWWIQSDGQTASYISPEKLINILEPETENLPPWANLSIDKPSGHPSKEGNVLLASAPIPLGHTLHLHANTTILTTQIRKRQSWLLALLTVAFLSALIALIAIHRTINQERHLANLKSQFVSSVSHELRAPLGSIRLMAEALQQGKTSKPEEFHNLIAKEGARLSHLVENVLDFAHIEEGRKRYRFEECDLKALLTDTLLIMQPLAAERKVTLHPEFSELTATLDPAAIQQALINLLDNALKFSPQGGKVTVSASIHHGFPQIRITDQGPGIPPQHHAAIFERFTRLGNELRRESQGTGIGLSIVQHIADAHKGSITITSTAPKGSIFTLTLSPNL